jgi:hypothetical protein
MTTEYLKTEIEKLKKKKALLKKACKSIAATNDIPNVCSIKCFFEGLHYHELVKICVNNTKTAKKALKQTEEL